MKKIETFLDGAVSLYGDDCLAVLPKLADNSIDSCVTDPPYHLTSIVKRFGKDGSAPAQYGKDGRYQRASAGFMNKTWDGGDIAQSVELWQQVFRVLKPGAHLLAFGGTRTYHRMACAIEDAGFEIRDTIMWLYGSGFPKSHDVSKGIDKAIGVEREVVGRKRFANGSCARRTQNLGGNVFADPESRESNLVVTAPATDAAYQWQGWGTALKPACEPIVLARKPLSEKTIVANVLKHGTGALNIDGCRVAANGEQSAREGGRRPHTHEGYQRPNATMYQDKTDWALSSNGRWPANLIHDGSEEVVQGFPDTTSNPGQYQKNGNGGFFGNERVRPKGTVTSEGDSGSSARFFYTAKADRYDRISRFIETVRIEWSSGSELHQAVLQVDTEQSLEKDIVASVLEGDSGWSTFLSGKTLTDLFQRASSCIIRTATNSTMTLPTWNWLMTLLIKECIVDVNYETENGGSLAGSAEHGTQQVIITLVRTVSLPGASRAASKTQLKISVSGRQHGHPTVKPLDLMQYLVRLVTPKGGAVLDPFAGTGTTGEAAFREGCKAVLIEREAEYQADIRKRMKLATMHTGAREVAAKRNKDPEDRGLFDL